MESAYTAKTILVADFDRARGEKTRQALATKLEGYQVVLVENHKELLRIYETMVKNEQVPAAIILDDYPGSGVLDSFKFLEILRSDEQPSKWESVKQTKPTPVYMVGKDDIYLLEAQKAGLQDHFYSVKNDHQHHLAMETIAASIKRQGNLKAKKKGTVER